MLSCRRQLILLDICARMTPSLRLQGRTNVYEAWDSNLGASTRDEEENGNSTEVQTLAIDSEWKGRCVLGDHWKEHHHNTPVCQANQSRDSELAGLWQADEGHVSPTAGGRMRESSISNGLLLLLRTWQQKWSPSSAVIQLGKMEPAQQSLQQQHRGSASVHSRRSSATRTSRNFWPAGWCIHTHHSICTHKQPPYAYTPLLIHTRNPYAYTPLHIYAHTQTRICIHMHTPVHTHNYTIPYAHTTPMTTSIYPKTTQQIVVICAMCPSTCRQSLFLPCDSISLIFLLSS